MTLRVVDAGPVNALASQALWHGLAEAAAPHAAPTLSFCQPTEPYVGLGYHRSLSEIDLDACGRRDLPVIRRRIGGGPVYLDDRQLFFQVTVPAEQAPRAVGALYERYLEPAVHAFRALGVRDAFRNGLNDIAVGERKISGTGAGQIGGGVTVVGNILFAFPHERMVEVLALPSEDSKRECLRLMKRHVSSLEGEGLCGVSAGDAKAALVEAYAHHLGGRVIHDELRDEERSAVGAWADRMSSPAWRAGPHADRDPGVTKVKISADACVFAGENGALSLEATLAGGRIDRVEVEIEGHRATAAAMSRALAGAKADPAVIAERLGAFGAYGRLANTLLREALRPI